MAARIDHGHAQLMTRTGLDWTNKYPSVIEALANVKAKTAYIDGELCGVDDADSRAQPLVDVGDGNYQAVTLKEVLRGVIDTVPQVKDRSPRHVAAEL